MSDTFPYNVISNSDTIDYVTKDAEKWIDTEIKERMIDIEPDIRNLIIDAYNASHQSGWKLAYEAYY